MQTSDFLLARPTHVRQDVALTLSSGFLATLAITTIMYVLPAVGLPQVDLPIWVARLFIADQVRAGALGMAIHLVVGLVFAWLYADQVEPRLPFGPAASGLVFGAVLWLFAQSIAVPALGVVAGLIRDGEVATPGLLSARFGAGAAAASLVAHLAYGVTLGYVYGCRAAMGPLRATEPGSGAEPRSS